MLRAASEQVGKECFALLDTKGPEIRTGFLGDKKYIDLEAGQDLDIVTDYDLVGSTEAIACSYKALPKSVKVGSQIFIGDGNLTCEVKEIFEDKVRVTCMNAYRLGERKNMNLPGSEVDLPTLTEKDIYDITEFGVKYGVDYIAVSFVRTGDDIRQLKAILKEHGAEHIQILSKIED